MTIDPALAIALSIPSMGALIAVVIHLFLKGAISWFSDLGE